MALSSYYRKYDAENLDALNQQKQIINQTADASIKMIEDAGNAQIKEAEHAYDGVINTANVQKLINERAVAERMANMGLTDSGLNRTQQTAIELSRSNAINNANIARQKQIDALALAVSQQVGQINIQRNTDIMNTDLTYNANRNAWASSMYDADQQAAASRYKAQLDNDAKINDNQTKAREALIGILDDIDISDDAKKAYTFNYYSTYGEDPIIDSYYNNLFPDVEKQTAHETESLYASYDAKYNENIDKVVADTTAAKKLVAQMPTYAKNLEEAIEWIKELYGDGNRGISRELAQYLVRYANSRYSA